MLQPASHEGGGHHLWQGSWGAISAPARPRASSKGFCNGCDQDPGKDRPRGRSQQGPLLKVLWAPARRRASLKGSAVDATRIRARTGPEGRLQEGPLSKVTWAPARRRASLKGSAADATRIRARTGPEGRSQEGASVKGPLGPGPAPGLFQRSLGPRPKGPDQKANRKRDHFQMSLGPRPGPAGFSPCDVTVAPVRSSSSPKQNLKMQKTCQQR